MNRSPAVIRYATGSTRIGPVFIACDDQGLCALRLCSHAGDERRAEAEVRRMFPRADFQSDPRTARQFVPELNLLLEGKLPRVETPLNLHGTPFQMRVWAEMQRVPRGETCTYSELARRVGRPRAVRAVGNACARNPIAILVPCHRVLRQDGTLGGYRWGASRKRMLLELEKS